MENNQKNTNSQQTKNILIIGIILIIAIVGIIYVQNQNRKEENVKETEIEISYTEGEELTEEEIEQEAERVFEEDYISVENFLGMLGIRKNGKELLFSNTDGKIDSSLIIYDSLDDRENKFQESSETINIDGKEYKLFNTGIKYDTYKSELLNYMSENVFEKYFTTYTKNINGTLYITNEVEEFYTLEALEKTDDGKYILTYNFEGESKETEITIDAKERIITEVNI